MFVSEEIENICISCMPMYMCVFYFCICLSVDLFSFCFLQPRVPALTTRTCNDTVEDLITSIAVSQTVSGCNYLKFK